MPHRRCGSALDSGWFATCACWLECASVLARNFMRFTGRASQSQLPRCPVPLDLEVLRLQLIVLLDGLLRWLGSRFGPFSADAHIDGLHFGVGPTVDDGCCGSSSLDSTTACWICMAVSNRPERPQSQSQSHTIKINQNVDKYTIHGSYGHLIPFSCTP